MTPALRAFHIRADGLIELEDVPQTMPAQGFLWVACARADYEARHPALQESMSRLGIQPMVDLHVSDLLNKQLPSHFDNTSWYDLIVFRRLVALPADEGQTRVLPSLDSNPVGFAVFDRLLLTVHPHGCTVREYFAQRLLQNPPLLLPAAPAVTGSNASLEAPGNETDDSGTTGVSVTATNANGSTDAIRGAARLPQSPADLMLRMVNHIVDSYLDLRRRLTRQLTELQQSLLDPKSQFHDWSVLLDARTKLATLEDMCEDQRGAVQEWIDSLDEWPVEKQEQARRERELLRVRSRDVLEHIERVLSHVRRLEQSSETAVQMHFSALSHRTNQIMRTLTVLTAIFLPLNLITGFFGMNFDALPLIHDQRGVWIILGLMALVAIGLASHFWRKRYLSSRV
jgi:magnesium transporter